MLLGISERSVYNVFKEFLTISFNMIDKPRKTLSISRNPSVKPVAAENVLEGQSSERPVARTGKRIITRDQLPQVQRAGKPKQKPVRTPPAMTRRSQRTEPQKPSSPSVLQAKLFSEQLNNLPIWRERRPLVLGIEQQVFHYFAEQGVDVSRRVMQKMLHYQTHNRLYLQQVQQGGMRYNLDGSTGGAIQPKEQEHASRTLAVLVAAESASTDAR